MGQDVGLDPVLSSGTEDVRWSVLGRISSKIKEIHVIQKLPLPLSLWLPVVDLSCEEVMTGTATDILPPLKKNKKLKSQHLRKVE